MLPSAPSELDVSPVAKGDETPAAPRRRTVVDRAWWTLMALVLLAGVAGQVKVWASDRGLWNDEIYIAKNLRDLSFLKLGGPLLYIQVAPPGWLIGEKAILEAFGGDEQLLKLPELLAAVMLLFLTAFVACRAVGRWGALIAGSLVALSPLVYYYAAELKQYAPEAALAMVIVAAAGLFGQAALDAPAPTRRHLIAFGSVVAVAVAGSYTALIVLSGAIAGVVLMLALERRWRAVALALLAAAPGLSIGLFQVFRRRHFGFMRNQEAFFPNGFPPPESGPADLVRWLPDMWQGLVRSPLGWNYPWIVLALVVAGLVLLLASSRRVWGSIIAGVFLAAIGAAAVHGLPLEGRVALYMIAPTAVAVASAVTGAGRAFRLIRRPALAALVGALAAAVVGVSVALVVSPAVVGSYHQVAHPRYRDDGRDMLREVAARLQPGDVVLAYYFSEPLVSWYGPAYKLPVVGLATMTTRAACKPDSVDDVLAGAKRVWYLRGAKFSRHPADYGDRVLAELTKRGTIVATSSRWRASTWSLVDLTAGPDVSPPTPSPNPDYECLTVRRFSV